MKELETTTISMKKPGTVKKKCVYPKGAKQLRYNREGIKKALKSMKNSVKGASYIPPFLAHQPPNVLNYLGGDGPFPIRGRLPQPKI